MEQLNKNETNNIETEKVKNAKENIAFHKFIIENGTKSVLETKPEYENRINNSRYEMLKSKAIINEKDVRMEGTLDKADLKSFFELENDSSGDSEEDHEFQDKLDVALEKIIGPDKYMSMNEQFDVYRTRQEVTHEFIRGKTPEHDNVGVPEVARGLGKVAVSNSK